MLEAFEAGCDDYVVKPFQMNVLKKRIEAILRRSGGEKDVFLYRGLKIDWKKKQVFYQEQRVSLTAKEYSLLELLVQNRGQVLTKETILERIWDIDGLFVVENTVSVTINRLRKKIEPDKFPSHICKKCIRSWIHLRRLSLWRKNYIIQQGASLLLWESWPLSWLRILDICFLTVCFLCCYIPLFSGIRKKYEKDLIQISDILEQLILGRKPSHS